jgi:hypothetical protein
MEASLGLLATLAADLGFRFHGELTLERHGDTVRWCYDGAVAIVSLRPDGTLDATFLEAPAHESVTCGEACCVYRSASRLAYRLTPDGCGRMAADMADFFAGIREPRFTFVGTA